MYAPEISIYEWVRQHKFFTEEACQEQLSQLCCPSGLQYPKYGHGYYTQQHEHYEFSDW